MASQLEQQSQAERAVLAEPERREEVVAELSQVQQQTRKLVAPTATWQQTLADGIQDLVSDVEHDLQARLRTVIHDVEEIIDQGDPKDTWADTEVWLRRQVAIVTVANRDMLTEPGRGADQNGGRAVRPGGGDRHRAAPGGGGRGSRRGGPGARRRA